jgi:hypothetical protein
LKAVVAFVLLFGAALGQGCAKPRSDFARAGEYTFTEIAGYPGMSIAAVEGDPAKGPAHFFLKLARGFLLGSHHHSADIHGAVIAGDLVLTVYQGPQLLGPGSYFSVTGQNRHAVRCNPGADCLLFIDARGKWDTVLSPP